MNEYLQNLVSNFARLYDLSTKFHNAFGIRARHEESVRKLSDFLRYLSDRISILIILPPQLTIEDNFYPFSTYLAFMQNNKDNKGFLEDLSYAIDKIVREIRKTGAFDEDLVVQSLPDSQISEVFKSFNDDDLKEIKELADKLSENMKATPFITTLWEIEAENSRQNKIIKEKDSKLDEAKKETSSKNVSKDFSEEYRKIREELEEEIAPFWQKKKEKKESCVEKIKNLRVSWKEKNLSNRLCQVVSIFSLFRVSAAIVFVVFLAVTRWLFAINQGVVLYWFVAFVVLRCFVFKRFNLHLKICALRLVTYAIPIFLILFHFCEFFSSQSQAIKNCIPCSWFVAEVNSNNENLDDSKSAENASVEINKAKVSLVFNSQNSHKNSDQSNSYIYFHLALITTLLIAYQQMRSAISEMNIKKNLIEIYRHRNLVARNYDIMYGLVDGQQDKTEVIKSAAKALFENEPSIYGSNTNPMPPKVFDINNILPKN